MKYLIVFLLALLVSCGEKRSDKTEEVIRSSIKIGQNLSLTRVSFDDLDGWNEDDHLKALHSMNNSCYNFAKLPDSQKLNGVFGISVADMRDVCELASLVRGMDSYMARNFFEHWFVPFLIKNPENSKKTLFTGYYETELFGSRKKSDRYKYPIYSMPDDVKQGVVYHSREVLDAGILDGKNLEIVFVDDKAKLFLTHIQGSAKVTLDDGVVIRIGYAGTNNQEYTAIGKILVEMKKIEKDNLNAISIYKFLKDGGKEADDVMNLNKRFVFFREIDNKYPIGAQGVQLVANRSIAIDKNSIPFGLPIWVQTKLPELEFFPDFSDKKYNKLLISQDTGAAINNASRADIFFGNGDLAETLASNMKSSGEYFVLIPINIAKKLSK